MVKYEGRFKSEKIIFPKIVHHGVSEGKLKIFGMSLKNLIYHLVLITFISNFRKNKLLHRMQKYFTPIIALKVCLLNIKYFTIIQALRKIPL